MQLVLVSNLKNTLEGINPFPHKPGIDIDISSNPAKLRKPDYPNSNGICYLKDQIGLKCLNYLMGYTI